jgi:hypothetical protein
MKSAGSPDGGSNESIYMTTEVNLLAVVWLNFTVQFFSRTGGKPALSRHFPGPTSTFPDISWMMSQFPGNFPDREIPGEKSLYFP